MIDLNAYNNIYNILSQRVIGKKAADGTKITKITFHCIDRICGTTEKPDNVKHEGIPLEDFEYTLFHGTVKKSTEDNTIIFITKMCKIAINPQNGVIKQCNRF